MSKNVIFFFFKEQHLCETNKNKNVLSGILEKYFAKHFVSSISYHKKICLPIAYLSLERWQSCFRCRNVEKLHIGEGIIQKKKIQMFQPVERFNKVETYFIGYRALVKCTYGPPSLSECYISSSM